MITQAAVQSNMAAAVFKTNSKLLSNIFGAQVTGRMVVPGLEAFSEAEERARERMEFEAVDDYIEQA